MRNARAAGATVLVAVALAASAVAAASSAPQAEVSPRAVTRDRAGDPPRVDEGVAAIEHWYRVESVGRLYAELERQADEKAREDLRRAALQRESQVGRVSRSGSRGLAPTEGVWAALAACESGGRWHLDARYDGGLQFDPPTWLSVRADDDPPFAYLASPERQIAAAQRLQARSGWGQWPRCSRKLGLR